MSFMDHLMELRQRLWVAAAVVLACMAGCIWYSEYLFKFLKVPLNTLNWKLRNSEDYAAMIEKVHLLPGADLVKLQSIDPLGIMVTVMWLGLGAGLVLASPVIFWEVWAFVAPGLKERERRAVTPVLAGGIFFFLGGCAIAYFALFPVTIEFMARLNISYEIEPNWTVEFYMSLLLNMLFMTGIACEAPLVVAVLAKLGLVSAGFLIRYWRICVLVSVVLGAIFSPGTEVMSMVLFSGLLLSLYIISIVFAYVFHPRKKRSAGA